MANGYKIERKFSNQSEGSAMQETANKVCDSCGHSNDVVLLECENCGTDITCVLPSSIPVLTDSRTTKDPPTLIDIPISKDVMHNNRINIGDDIMGFLITDVIAENGGDSEIFLCELKNKQYAAKIYHNGIKPKIEILNAITKIRSPYVMNCVVNGEFKNRCFVILPYFQCGDLQKACPLNEEFISKTVVPDVNEALNVIHQKNIVHRDIKPGNMFFTDGKNHVVIGDFGISSQLTDKEDVRITNCKRTPGYSAPETAHGFVSIESDYYSFGVSLLNLATGIDPFTGMNDLQILMCTLNYPLEIPSSVSSRLAKLIRGLTRKDRMERWGYNEIKQWLINTEN